MTMMLRGMLLLWAVLTVITTTTFGQSVDFPFSNSLLFHRIGPKQGLPAQPVFGSCVDSLGFVWFATYSGLYRYDGTKMTHYRSRGTGSAIPNDTVTSVMCDRLGTVWVTTASGISRFNKITNTFANIPYDSTGRNGVPMKRCRELTEMSDGRIWVAGSGGICILNSNGAVYRWLQRPTSMAKRTASSLGPYSNGVMCEDRKGRVWLGSWDDNTGVSFTDLNASKVTSFGDPESYSRPCLTWDIQCDKTGTMWFGTFVGLYSVSGRDLSVVYHSSPTYARRPPHMRYRCLLPRSDGRLWLGTDAGLVLFDPRTGRSQAYESSLTDYTKLPGNQVLKMEYDRSGRLWICTDLGVAMLEPWAESVVRVPPLITAGRPIRTRRPVAFDAMGRFWMGAFSQGETGTGLTTQIAWFSPNTHNVRSAEVKRIPFSAPNEGLSYIKALRDNQHLVWTARGGVIVDEVRQRSRVAPSLLTNPYDNRTDYESSVFATEVVDGKICVVAKSGIHAVSMNGERTSLPAVFRNSPVKLYGARKGGTIDGGFWWSDHSYVTAVFQNEGLTSVTQVHHGATRYNEPYLVRDRMGRCIAPPHFWFSPPDTTKHIMPLSSVLKNTPLTAFNSPDGDGLLFVNHESILHIAHPDSVLIDTVFSVNGAQHERINDVIVHEDKTLIVLTSSRLVFLPQNGAAFILSLVDDLGITSESETIHFSSASQFLSVGTEASHCLLHYPTVRRSFSAAAPPRFASWKTGKIEGLITENRIEIPFYGSDRYVYASIVPLAVRPLEWEYSTDGKNWNVMEEAGVIPLSQIDRSEFDLFVRYRKNDGEWVASPVPLRVILLAPWYESWWALGLFASGSIGLFLGAVRWRTKRIEQRSRDLERIVDQRTRELADQTAKTESLLLNILPNAVTKRLMDGEKTIADRYPAATVLFVDIVDFTSWSSAKEPQDVVRVLDELFQMFDKIIERNKLEKIKTIGDAYMAASGVPEENDQHARCAALAALDIRDAMIDHPSGLRVRIGLNAGPVVAAVVGRKKFAYDLWGDTVNVAARMEHSAEPMTIHTTESHAMLLASDSSIVITPRGDSQIKGKGVMTTYTIERA